MKDKYIIMGCEKRRHYIEEYLVLSLTEQGISSDDIQVSIDDGSLGNLGHFLQICRRIRKEGDPSAATWLLQDDILISEDFKERTESCPDMVAHGFCNEFIEKRNAPCIGLVDTKRSWLSFVCVRIPNRYIAEFLDWYETRVVKENRFRLMRRQNKGDDVIFRKFMFEKHPDDTVLNMHPNIAEHVDYLLGGSIANAGRKCDARSMYFADRDLIQDLEDRLRAKDKYLIMGCPARRWYIEGYLLPSLLSQGIPREDIYLSMDDSGLGDLKHFFAICERIRDTEDPSGATWLLQDDILISRDFKERTDQCTDGVAYGFCNKAFDPDNVEKDGLVCMEDSWASFQCIRIPNAYCGEFLDWYRSEAMKFDRLRLLRRHNKGDDVAFRTFLFERHPGDKVLNIWPNIAEHVDYLIGGSVINRRRRCDARSYCFEDKDLIDELQKRLAREGRMP